MIRQFSHPPHLRKMNVQVDNMITNFVVQEDWIVSVAYTITSFITAQLSHRIISQEVSSMLKINVFKNRLDTLVQSPVNIQPQKQYCLLYIQSVYVDALGPADCFSLINK